MSRHNPTQGTIKKNISNHKEFDSVSLNISNQREDNILVSNTTVPYKIRLNNVSDNIDQVANEVNNCKSFYSQVKLKRKEVYDHIKRTGEDTYRNLNGLITKFEGNLNQHYKEQREKIKMHETSVAGLRMEKEELSNELALLEEKVKKLEIKLNGE